MRALPFLALGIGLSTPAVAAAEDEVQTIVVTGVREGYGAKATTSATRTATDLRNIPQAVSVVTAEQIDDAGLRSIGDVLRYVPGALIGQGEGHRDQVTLRGNGSTADFFVDGLRDDVQYYRGLYNVARIEVLKGPNAMIFGRGGGGGVVNRVSKRPVADAFAGGAASVDSFGSWFVEADINQPLGGAIAGRVNAVYERFDTHRDVYGGDRFAINPTVGIDLGPATRVGLSYEYAQDERIVDRGIPSSGGRPLAGARDTFFGARGINRSDFDAHVVHADVSHDFGENLNLTSKLLFGDYDKAYANAFAATAVVAGRVDVEAYRDETSRQNLFVQNDLVWRTNTGPIGHVLLGGLEYGNQSTRNARINGFFAGGPRTSVALADPFIVPPITFRDDPSNRRVRSEADVFAVYAQDQISIGRVVEVVAGLRYDRFTLRVDNRLNGQSFARTDDLWSPRLGLVLKPTAAVSLYGSYSRSFLPQSGDQFLGLDPTLAALEPEEFDNLEVGAKWAPRDGLLLTAAAYRLDRTNGRAPGAIAGQTVLTGEQRSRGIELGASGRLTSRWNVNAGYVLQDAEIRRTTGTTPAGRTVPLVPRHQASLWTRYDPIDRVGVGLGVYHQSRVFASLSNAVALPAYTRVDGALFVQVADGVEAQVNIENLLGETYFPTAHNDNNISTGAPRNVRATVRARF